MISRSDGTAYGVWEMGLEGRGCFASLNERSRVFFGDWMRIDDDSCTLAVRMERYEV